MTGKAIDIYRAELADRQADEAARIDAVRLYGEAPGICGPDIGNAPARGPVIAFMPETVLPDGTADGYAVRSAGYRDRHAALTPDAFHKMQQASIDFTLEQVEAGRTYGRLVEETDAAGYRGQDFQGGSGGGGLAGGGFAPAFANDLQRLRRMQAAIGDGFALVVVRKSRAARVSITRRRLVDMVCVEGATATDVLQRHGWSLGPNIAKVQGALASALQRIVHL